MANKYSKEILNLLRSIQNIDYVSPEEIPDIDLYMDQITTFMDEHLASSKRFEEDKILTKTMINNYTKNALLPPSKKKKYTKEHMILLIFIYYFKNFLTINDIKCIRRVQGNLRYPVGKHRLPGAGRDPKTKKIRRNLSGNRK